MSQVKHNFPYYIVPNDIHEIGLNPYQIAVYCYISRCANNSTAFTSYNTIAKKTGMGRVKAINTVKELIEIKLIEKKVRKKSNDDNETNIYTVSQPSISQILPSTSEIPPSICNIPNKELFKNNYLKRINVITGSDDNIFFFSSIFDYYIDKYYVKFRKQHPNIKECYIDIIIKVIDDYSDEHELYKTQEWHDIIDRYFDSNMDCDYNMIHFANERVIHNKAHNLNMVDYVYEEY